MRALLSVVAAFGILVTLPSLAGAQYYVMAELPAGGITPRRAWPDRNDVNGDGLADLTFSQAVGMSLHLRTYVAPNFDLYWDYVLDELNSSPNFQGFYDVDADGDKEAYLILSISGDPEHYAKLVVIDTQTGDTELSVFTAYTSFADFNGDGHPECAASLLGEPSGVQVWTGMHGGTSSVDDDRAGDSARPILLVRNPTPQVASVRYSVSAPGHCRLKAYGVDGSLVQTILDAERTTGTYFVGWPDESAGGMAIHSGTYFLKLETPGGVATEKILLVR